MAFTSIGILSVGITNQASAHEQTYQVQAGDSLWKIASTHHVTVDQIIQYNHLSSSSIYVGQKLSLLEPHSHNQTASYTVKSGDSLTLIAKNYKISVTDLKSMNQLSSDLIHIGQILTVPVKTEPANLASSSVKSNNTSYTVQPGDTLSKIALSTGVSVTQLKTLNHLSTDTIKVGQVLNLTEKQVAQPILNAEKLLAEAKKYIGVPMYGQAILQLVLIAQAI